MARTQGPKRDTIIRCAKIRNDNVLLKQTINAAEWNKLLTWARKGARAQWDNGTAMHRYLRWHVKKGSESYYGQGVGAPKDQSVSQFTTRTTTIVQDCNSQQNTHPFSPISSFTAEESNLLCMPREQHEDHLYDRKLHLNQHPQHFQQPEMPSPYQVSHTHQYMQQPFVFNNTEKSDNGYSDSSIHHASLLTPDGVVQSYRPANRISHVIDGGARHQEDRFPASSPQIVYLQPQAGLDTLGANLEPHRSGLHADQRHFLTQRQHVQVPPQHLQDERQQQQYLQFGLSAQEADTEDNYHEPSLGKPTTSAIDSHNRQEVGYGIRDPMQMLGPSQHSLALQEQQHSLAYVKKQHPISAFHRQRHQTQQKQQQYQHTHSRPQHQQQAERYDGFLRHLPRARLSRKPLIHHPSGGRSSVFQDQSRQKKDQLRQQEQFESQEQLRFGAHSWREEVDYLAESQKQPQGRQLKLIPADGPEQNVAIEIARRTAPVSLPPSALVLPPRQSTFLASLEGGECVFGSNPRLQASDSSYHTNRELFEQNVMSPQAIFLAHQGEEQRYHQEPQQQRQQQEQDVKALSSWVQQNMAMNDAKEDYTQECSGAGEAESGHLPPSSSEDGAIAQQSLSLLKLEKHESVGERPNEETMSQSTALLPPQPETPAERAGQAGDGYEREVKKESLDAWSGMY